MMPSTLFLSCLVYFSLFTTPTNQEITGGREVNVDIQVDTVANIMNNIRKINAFPLASFEYVVDPMLLPGVNYSCATGSATVAEMSRRMGNTLHILNESRTVLTMKLRCGESSFEYPVCSVNSTTSFLSSERISLGGTLQSSDFDIELIMDHHPTCKTTVGKATLVEMGNMSFTFLEKKLPKFLSEMISNFLVKYNRDILDERYVTAVSDNMDKLIAQVNLCEMFHPNLRSNDEL